MNNIRKIASIGSRFISVGLMLFLLSFLTVGNLFIYDEDQVVVASTTTNDSGNNSTDNKNKQPISSEEEKPSTSKSLSGNLTEEYLHEHDLILHLYNTVIVTPSGDYVHTHGLGDDHSRLHCPPPDFLS